MQNCRVLDSYFNELVQLVSIRTSGHQFALLHAKILPFFMIHKSGLHFVSSTPSHTKHLNLAAI